MKTVLFILMKDRAPSYLFGVVLKLNSLEVSNPL